MHQLVCCVPYAAFWKVPDILRTPGSFAELCCGGVNGWAEAAEALDLQVSVLVDDSISCVQTTMSNWLARPNAVTTAPEHVHTDLSAQRSSNQRTQPRILHASIRDTEVWQQLDEIEFSAAGAPCQPHSYAGARRGSADSRCLIDTSLRIIDVQRPKAFLIENVTGLFAKWLKAHSLGYHMLVASLDAARLLPQKRERGCWISS